MHILQNFFLKGADLKDRWHSPTLTHSSQYTFMQFCVIYQSINDMLILICSPWESIHTSIGTTVNKLAYITESSWKEGCQKHTNRKSKVDWFPNTPFTIHDPQFFLIGRKYVHQWAVDTYLYDTS